MIPIVRAGLNSLMRRCLEAARCCNRMRKSGVIQYELGVLNKKIAKTKQELDDLKAAVALFALFNRPEAVLIEDRIFLDCAKRCLAIQREQHLVLQEIEEQLALLDQ